MALSTLPYKYKITASSLVNGKVQVTLTILNGAGATIVSGLQVLVDPTIPPTDFFDTVRNIVVTQMYNDAGGAQPLIAALTGQTITISQ